MDAVKITPKGARHFRTGHPWIYKGDLAGPLPDEAGIVTVEDHAGRSLAAALFSPRSQIALRILTRRKETVDRDWFARRIRMAVELRNRLAIPSDANRLIFGESDGLPAFIVDRFSDIVSFQTLSAGIDRYKDVLLEILDDELKPAAMIERNDAPVRRLEGLSVAARIIKGTSTIISIREGDAAFRVDALAGQKTGAYLDQRDNRLLAGRLAYGKVLDCFSFEGWFAIHMAKNADSVLCVDSSANALSMVQENAKINGYENKITTIEANGFDLLKGEEKKGTRYDCINLDPPPFVKSAKDRESGRRGYKEINLRAMRMLKRGGLLITASCSHHFSDDDLDAVLGDAASDAGVTAQVLYRTGAAPDHPILAAFPESHYLKCRFLKISA